MQENAEKNKREMDPPKLHGYDVIQNCVFCTLYVVIWAKIQRTKKTYSVQKPKRKKCVGRKHTQKKEKMTSLALQ